jgi:hypothetical protein
MADMLMEHDDKLRGAGKSRGAYLLWLDNRIAIVRSFNDEPPLVLEALQEAREAFTKEFYP